MTDPTNNPPTINPLWITLALPVLRWVLVTTGTATAATADSEAGAVLPALVAIATGLWSVWSWWKAHQKALTLNKLPAGSAVVK